jgi:hypothetical protein
MDILTGFVGLSIGAVAAWRLARARGDEEVSRLRAQWEERIAHWRSETERARARAARTAEQAAAWAAGCQQGRADLLSLTRALARQAAEDAGGPEAG